MKRNHALAILAALLGTPAVALAQTYTATALQFTGVSINNSDQVVGFGANASGASDGFLYSHGTITDLGAFVPSSINNDGVIAGSSVISGHGVAETYTNGVVTNLMLGPNSSGSRTTAINDSGLVIGNSSSATGKESSFLYDTHTSTVTVLPCFSRRCFQASDINDSAKIAGTLEISNSIPPGGVHDNAAVYDHGTITDLGTLTSGTQFPQNDSVASAINDSGEVAGTSFDAASNQVAVIFDKGTVTEIGPVTTVVSAGLTVVGGVNDINDGGLVVGTNCTIYAACIQKGPSAGAFLWNGNSLIYLNSALSRALPDGMWLSSAAAINDSGVIIADATNSSGLEESFLLTPHAAPEMDPSLALTNLSFLLGTLAVFGNGIRRRRPFSS